MSFMQISNAVTPVSNNVVTTPVQPVPSIIEAQQQADQSKQQKLAAAVTQQKQAAPTSGNGRRGSIVNVLV